jgi:predicted aspartyl protease
MSKITVNLYLAAVHIGEYIVHGVRAVAVSSGDESIVGRDVLNQLEVLLNGPAHEVWIR